MRTSEEMKRVGELKDLFVAVTQEISDRPVYTECMHRLGLNFQEYEKENGCKITKAITEYDNIDGWIGCKLKVYTDKGVKHQYFSLDKPIPAA